MRQRLVGTRQRFGEAHDALRPHALRLARFEFGNEDADAKQRNCKAPRDGNFPEIVHARTLAEQMRQESDASHKAQRKVLRAVGESRQRRETRNVSPKFCSNSTSETQTDIW